MKIKYTGKESEVCAILSALNSKGARVQGRAIVIPTVDGAKEFYIGETIVIENGEARLEGEGE